MNVEKERQGKKMTMQIIVQLKEIIANKLDLNIAAADVTPDAALFEEGLGLDSIAIVELIALVEDEFGFEFDEDHLNLEAFHDVQTLADFIAEQTNEAVPA